MFTSLNTLEKIMRKILIDFKNNATYPDVSDSNTAYAFYLCCEKGYIANVFTYQNANRNYLFQKSGNDHITDEGLKFIHDTSIPIRFLHAIFSIFKGMLGFILGIVATVTAAYIIWYFGWL